MPATATQTCRERFLETLTFGSPDRVPFTPGNPRESTLSAWHRQGLAEGRGHMEALREELGIEPDSAMPRVHPGVNLKMIPTFEEKVLEHAGGHYILQDWMGNVVEISDRYDYTYIRNALDFVTRKWHKFPVEGREDFEKNMKWRYDPAGPGRYPEDFSERCRRLRGRDYPVSVGIPGPFWQLREWCGFEPLCIMFIEQPDFVEEMVAFWTQFVSRALKPLLAEGVVDVLHISEDMAYKEKSMISPEMARRFLQPTYGRWCSEARAAGVPLVDMDSDGKVEELIPIWIDSSIRVCDPMEVAAGNDINEYRKKFGRSMAYAGGVDKRCIARGGKVIEAELARIEPVVRDGGYIPSCDHGVPPDISWPDYVHYARLLAEMTGWV